MIRIKDLRELGLTAPDGTTYELPEEFLDVLPETCSCGGDLSISETLTTISCSNIHCIARATQRMCDMFKALGILGFGEAKCRALLQQFPFADPYLCFLCKEKDWESRFQSVISKDAYLKLLAQLDAARTQTLAKAVALGYLPGIQDTSTALFENYDSIAAFYADFDNPDTGNATMIAKLLKLNPSNIRVLNICRILTAYKTDLLRDMQFFNIKAINHSLKRLKYGISESINGYSNKQVFADYIAEKYSDKYDLIWVKSFAPSTCQFLICEAGASAGTNKTTKAQKAGIPIYTSAQLLELLDKGTL